MKYEIEISSVAEAEADKAFLWLSGVTDSEKASHWYQELLKAIESLSEMPKRCGLAPENDYFSQEIRQLLYGRDRNCYRILFTILENSNFSTVRILHIRHAARDTLGKNPEDRD